MIKFVLILTLNCLLGYLMHRFIKRLDKQHQPPTYRFRLYRRIRNEDNTVITTMDVSRQCYDPFVERIKLAHEYPGFAIGTDFTSETDEAYDAISADDADDFFAGYED